MDLNHLFVKVLDQVLQLFVILERVLTLKVVDRLQILHTAELVARLIKSTGEILLWCLHSSDQIWILVVDWGLEKSGCTLYCFRSIVALSDGGDLFVSSTWY